MNTAAPTITQQQYIDYIGGFTATKGYAPTFREIGKHFGCAPNAVTGHLKALRKKGLLTWEPGLSRTFKVVSR